VPDSRITIDRILDVPVARLTDAAVLDMRTVEQLGSELGAALAGDPGHRLVVDFSNVRTVSSAALGVLISIRKQALQMGGNIGITGVNSELRNLLQITGMDKLFKQYESPQAAATAIGKSGN
jgi:anti-anti-sigma factor